MFSHPKSFPLTFIKKEKIARDIYSLYFDRSKEEFDFLPGQYMRISLSIKDKPTSHFFTIASSPLEKKHVMITVRNRLSDFKQTLLSLQTGEEVSFFGPLGGFYFDQTDIREKVFLAGGIGTTPFYSMIKYITKKKLPIPITLITSFSTVEEIIYYNELMQLDKEFSNIKIIYTLTKPNPVWHGETGRISESLIKKYMKDITKPIYYIVGSGEMVSETEELLEGIGVSLENIKVESFTGY
ncbi:MAG TPA: FAD-dependent oxidoreductase [Candidatus Saccharimonadales bacterium]|nr:FAD-dependent oxidoreductase [Candidatus Saccharimonadales bacterium]